MRKGLMFQHQQKHSPFHSSQLMKNSNVVLEQLTPPPQEAQNKLNKQSGTNSSAFKPFGGVIHNDTPGLAGPSDAH